MERTKSNEAHRKFLLIALHRRRDPLPTLDNALDNNPLDNKDQHNPAGDPHTETPSKTLHSGMYCMRVRGISGVFEALTAAFYFRDREMVVRPTETMQGKRAPSIFILFHPSGWNHVYRRDTIPLELATASLG